MASHSLRGRKDQALRFWNDKVGPAPYYLCELDQLFNSLSFLSEVCLAAFGDRVHEKLLASPYHVAQSDFTHGVSSAWRGFFLNL